MICSVERDLIAPIHFLFIVASYHDIIDRSAIQHLEKRRGEIINHGKIDREKAGYRSRTDDHRITNAML